MICVLYSLHLFKIEYLQVFYGKLNDDMNFITGKTIVYWDIRPDFNRQKREEGVVGYVQKYFDNESDCVKEIIPFIFKH